MNETASTVAGGCILDAAQDAKSEIPARILSMRRRPKSAGPSLLQYVFASGVLAALIVAAIVLGTSLFTTLIGIAAIVIGILNALLVSTEKAPPDQGWFLSALQRALSVTPFLKVATALIWCVALGLGTYGALRFYRAAQLIVIEGAVVTARGEAADNVSVSIYLDPGKVTTFTSGGKFAFKNINIKNLNNKSVVLEARGSDGEAKLSLDVSAGPPAGPLVLTLSPRQPPFRVTYFLIGGHAIDFLLRGEVDKRWEERLAGQPFIVPNSVFRALKELTVRFSAPFHWSYFSLESGPKTQQYADLAQKNAGRSFFVGSWPGRMYYRSLIPGDVAGFESAIDEWYVALRSGTLTPKRKAPIDFKSLIFWRFAKREDFSQPARPYSEDLELDFYRHITTNSMPTDFAILTMRYYGCGDEVELHIIPRYLQLRAALIENIADHPIRIRSFWLAENDHQGLRTRDEDQQALARRTASPAALFPQETLKPGETLSVPLELVFRYEESDNINDLLTTIRATADPGALKDAASRMETVKQIGFRPAGKPQWASFIVPGPVVAALMTKPKPTPGAVKEYVWGPSMRIEKVDVDEGLHAVRQYEPSAVVLRSGKLFGSCPYVFTYAPSVGSWHNEGHVLYGFYGKDKQAFDKKSLNHFDGRVRIRELEPEVSFIDSVSVKLVDGSGVETTCLPRNGRLRQADDIYVVLRQGEEIEVEFDVPTGVRWRRAVLLAKGYYVSAVLDNATDVYYLSSPAAPRD